MPSQLYEHWRSSRGVAQSRNTTAGEPLRTSCWPLPLRPQVQPGLCTSRCVIGAIARSPHQRPKQPRVERSRGGAGKDRMPRKCAAAPDHQFGLSFPATIMHRHYTIVAEVWTPTRSASRGGRRHLRPDTANACTTTLFVGRLARSERLFAFAAASRGGRAVRVGGCWKRRRPTEVNRMHRLSVCSGRPHALGTAPPRRPATSGISANASGLARSSITRRPPRLEL